MLKLRDFLHLPQLDELIEQLVADKGGLILLAGIDARPSAAQDRDAIAPSGLSAIFNILMQEILLADPLAQAIIVTEERGLARVPRQIKRRVRLLPVDMQHSYAAQIDMAMHNKPSLLVIDRLDASSAPPAFRAAASGLRVLAQFDSVLRGTGVARSLIELGVPRAQLSALHWIMTTQRMALLCPHCKHSVIPDPARIDRLCGRHPHLRPVCDQLLTGAARFYRAGSGCEHCRQTGYQGDIALFDLFRSDTGREDFFGQSSLLSLEEYALRICAEGQIDLDDLLDLESDHLRRTYQMLTTSERALTEANTELNRKLVELEASNRVLIQRTEVLMSLQDLGQALITSSDLKELAGRICRRASELCGADRAVLYLRRRSSTGAEVAEVLAVRGWDAAQIGRQMDPSAIFEKPAGQKTGRYMQVPPGFRSEMDIKMVDKGVISMGLRVPLLVQSEQVGAMVIQSTQKEYFTQGETALLQTFANQAALAIQRAGLVDELRAKIAQLEAAQAELVKKERIDRELELAREVQQSMLPHSFPNVPGYQISAHNEPARQVGGDFYDLILLDEDHFGVVIADVADKGMPAALYMALTRSLLLAEARRAISPRKVLLNVNQLLQELGELDGFVSVFYGVVERSTRRMTYVRAGHERPLLLRQGETFPLRGDGAVLGAFEDPNLVEDTLTFEPGDRLVLYTDGLTDVANESGKFSGRLGLEELLRVRASLPIEEMCKAIFAGLAAYRGQADPFDDMTLLVLEVEGGVEKVN